MIVLDTRPGAADLIGIAGEPATLAFQFPRDMARLLRDASPHGAAPFALIMHEQACEAQDVEQSEFWLDVVDELRR